MSKKDIDEGVKLLLERMRQFPTEFEEALTDYDNPWHDLFMVLHTRIEQGDIDTDEDDFMVHALTEEEAAMLWVEYQTIGRSVFTKKVMQTIMDSDFAKSKKRR